MSRANNVSRVYGETVKPCPLCGGFSVLERKSKTYIQGVLSRVTYCRCTRCDCRGPRKLLGGSDELDRVARIEAIECWNRRVSDED